VEGFDCDPSPVNHREWRRIFVRKLRRTALFSTIALLSILPAGQFVAPARAAAVPAAASPAKKKNKPQKVQWKKKKILKGHHGKRDRNHA
jgi:hypothetical protein